MTQRPTTINTLKTFPLEQIQPIGTKSSLSILKIVKLLLIFICIQLVFAIAVLVMKIVMGYIGFNQKSKFWIKNQPTPCGEYSKQILMLIQQQLTIFSISLVMILVCIVFTIIIFITTIRTFLRLRQQSSPNNSLPGSVPNVIHQHLHQTIPPTHVKIYYIFQSLIIMTTLVVSAYYLTFFINMLKIKITQKCKIGSDNQIIAIWIVSLLLLIVSIVVWILIVILNYQTRNEINYLDQQSTPHKYKNSQRTPNYIKHQLTQNNQKPYTHENDTKQQIIPKYIKPNQQIYPKYINQKSSINHHEPKQQIYPKYILRQQLQTFNNYINKQQPKQSSPKTKNFKISMIPVQQQFQYQPVDSINSKQVFTTGFYRENQQNKNNKNIFNHQQVLEEPCHKQFIQSPYRKIQQPIHEDDFQHKNQQEIEMNFLGKSHFSPHHKIPNSISNEQYILRSQLQQYQKDRYQHSPPRRILPQGHFVQNNRKQLDSYDEMNKPKGILNQFMRGKYPED